MLWGPPDTLMNRTVVPALMLSLLGSNAAMLVPLPVIFTSTTAPAGAATGAALSALGAGVVAAACDSADILSAPQATISNAAIVGKTVDRIAYSLRVELPDSACAP